MDLKRFQIEDRDVTKLRELVQFQAKVTWEQGLKETIKWFREENNG